MDQGLRGKAMMPLDEFDRLWGVGSCKPKLPLFKKAGREFARIYNQVSIFNKVVKPIVYQLKKCNPLVRKSSIPIDSSYSHQVFLVVYQVNGLSIYWKEAIKQIAAMEVGFTIIANGGLPRDDVHYLDGINNVAVYCRDNYGLDFGGYKEAMLEAFKASNVKKVTLINDSFFFPIFGKVEDVFSEIDKKNDDFVGVVENTNIDSLLDFHYGSFFIQIREPLLRNKNFSLFWKNYKLSESKKATIVNGEKGLSQFVRNEGFSYSVVYDYSELLERVNGVTTSELL